MSQRMVNSFWRLALCLGVALCITTGLASAADQKRDPADDAKDPRSGAALNLDAAKRALAAGLSTVTRTTARSIFSKPVNDPTADATAQDTQSETTAIDLGGGNLVAAWNDSGSLNGGNKHFTGYAWSANNGKTWTDGGTLPDSAGGDAGDPVLAHDKTTGRVYLATLEFTSLTNIQVFRSDDMGHTFLAPINGTPGVPGDQDKEWIAVDNFAGTGQGNVYLCWTRFNPGGNIMFTRSTDGGATFGPSGGIEISGGASQSQGCFVTVSPNHQVNVAYFRSDSGDNKLYMRRSFDRGQTFQPEVMIADLSTTATNGNLGLNGGLRSNSFPHCAVNPVLAKPHQVCVFNDDPNLADPTDNGDIFMVTSTDGGATWSPRKRVNDDRAGDQFFPTIAFLNRGKRLMIGYYSRSQDPANLMFHRRGRLGEIRASGNVLFNDSFQLSPNTPVVIGQDPVINATYMGDYDIIAGGARTFTTVWSDNRSGNAFHTRQPDVRAARISVDPPATDLRVTVNPSADSISVGDDVVFTVRASSVGGDANDVFLNIVPPSALAIQSVAGGQCSNINGLVGCSLGTIADGTSKRVLVTAKAQCNPGAKTFKASGTMSSVDAVTANNADSAQVTILAGAAVRKTYTTGTIATPIPDVNTVEVPLLVGHTGTVCNVRVSIRLNHTFDADLDIVLVSPTGETVELSTDNGGGGDNYGTGANDCSGTKTVFDDAAATSIVGSAAPFAGSFRPEQPLSTLSGVATNGTWKLRITDDLSGDTGTIGCFDLRITRIP